MTLRRAGLALTLLMALYALATLVAGFWVLPPMLLHPAPPPRDPATVSALQARLGSAWTRRTVPGGEGRPLEVWRLHREHPRGVILYLHGFGDDAWGVLPTAEGMTDWDAVGFTFRGRDRHPEVPCTLGGWEHQDVVAVVLDLLAEGVPAKRIVVAGWSMGGGTALLALRVLEDRGIVLGGALLECPFASLQEATWEHLRGTLGPFTVLSLPAQRLALWHSGRRARFAPDQVNAVRAAQGLRTPRAFLTGTADPVTPAQGVLAVAGPGADIVLVPNAGHCEAGTRLPGGWRTWALHRLDTWIP